MLLTRLGMRRSDPAVRVPRKGSAIPMEDGLDPAIPEDLPVGVPRDAAPANARRRPAAPWWREALAPYVQPSRARALLDIATSVVPYLALSCAMYLALGVSYPLALVLAFPAAGFLVRTFILFHDCSHGSFFPSKRANAWLGVALGLLLYSPFLRWRHDHAVHHATSGDLGRRGVGDIRTLTIAEYGALRRRGRAGVGRHTRQWSGSVCHPRRDDQDRRTWRGGPHDRVASAGRASTAAVPAPRRATHSHAWMGKTTRVSSRETG